MARPKKNEPIPGLIRVPADETKPLKYWQASVELAPVNGKRQRKTARSKDWDTAYRKLREMKQQARDNPYMSARTLTVEAWSRIWLESIAAKKNRPKTVHTYRGLITREILPVIGTKRLDALAPADIRAVLDNTLTRLSPNTAHQVHRILAVMLKYAMVEGHTHRNVAKLVDSPPRPEHDSPGLTVEQAIHLISHARDNGDPLWTLWAAVLLTGARQGELLGLEIDRVGDFIDLSWQLQRVPYEHGCGGTCMHRKAGHCPQRKVTFPADWKNRPLHGGLWLSVPKTQAGTRVIPLVEPLRSIILTHIATDTGPNLYGLVWHTPDGRPIDPRDESRAWHDALDAAGLPSIRLHDGRHTTIDLLYEAGVPEDIIMEIVGHSVRAVTRGYKSKAKQVRKIAAMKQLAELFTRTDVGGLGTLAPSVETRPALPQA